MQDIPLIRMGMMSAKAVAEAGYRGLIAVTLFGYLGDVPLAEAVGLIWLAHVGIDRALGFGLKYASAFGDTHLGRIGRAARRSEQPA